jgi:hypothetical protein
MENEAETVDMKYTDGDRLLYKGVSGKYSTIVTDIPMDNKTITFYLVSCTDKNGNNYSTVWISAGRSGFQTWMKSKN